LYRLSDVQVWLTIQQDPVRSATSSAPYSGSAARYVFKPLFTAYADAAEEKPRPARNTLAITFGHNKDHRPDLKQLLYILTLSHDGGVPVHFRAASGNVTDDQTHRDTRQILCRLAGRSDFLYVADCKLATTENVTFIHGHGGRFVSTLPRTRKEDHPFHASLLAEQVRWRPLWGNLKYSIDHARIAVEATRDGVLPLVTNDPTLSEPELLHAYKRQPLIEKRFSQMKADFQVPPVWLKDVGRIEALLGDSDLGGRSRRRAPAASSMSRGKPFGDDLPIAFLALLGAVFPEIDPLAVDLDECSTAAFVQPVLRCAKRHRVAFLSVGKG
jgi:hypothetical protein